MHHIVEKAKVASSIRCPECEFAILNTPQIITRCDQRKKQKLPMKICRRCKVIIIDSSAKDAGWKIWNNQDYVDYTT